MALERLVVLETQVETIIKRLDHQDKCIDALKRQVWLATGAVIAVSAFLKLVV